MGVVVHIFNASVWEVEAGRLGVHGQTPPQSRFKISLGYTRFWFLFFKETVEFFSCH